MNRAMNLCILAGSLFAVTACNSTDSDTGAAQSPTAAQESTNTNAAGNANPIDKVGQAGPPLKSNLEGYGPATYRFPTDYQPSQDFGMSANTHQQSWVGVANRIQLDVTRRLPLVESSFPATHNSFNSTAYPGVSSSGDPNHTLTLTEQIQLGMTGLELDLHWLVHAQSGGYAPVVCHGLGASMGHFGCTPLDTHLRTVLEELRAEISKPQYADVVFMLDLEDSLAEYSPPNSAKASVQAHDQAAALFKEILGELIYTPTEATGKEDVCSKLDLAALSKQSILNSGKRIVVVSGCGEGNAWKNIVFQFDRVQKANDGFDASSCEVDFFKPTDYASKFTRLWEDSTRLGAATNSSLKPITADDIVSMNRCGLHQASIDRLTVVDSRLAANLWSWAKGQPAPSASAQCTWMNEQGRWEAGACDESRSYACKDGNQWRILQGGKQYQGVWNAGRTVCEAEGYQFTLPRNARENEALHKALTANGAQSVWINWKDLSGQGEFPLPPARR